MTAHDRCNRPALLTYSGGMHIEYAPGCENFRPGMQRAALLQTYPNPVDGSVTVVVPALENESMARSSAHAVLYNHQGQAVRQASGAAGLNIGTADLPAGLYNLVVEQEGKVLRKHIEVKH